MDVRNKIAIQPLVLAVRPKNVLNLSVFAGKPVTQFAGWGFETPEIDFCEDRNLIDIFVDVFAVRCEVEGCERHFGGEEFVVRS